MNPLRKRFFGDTVVAQRYTGEAMGLLEAVYTQMGQDGHQQYSMHRTLGNGVELFAASRFGQDEIRIFVRPKPPGGRGGGSEYCVWENDVESFTEPLTLIRHYGPYAGAGSKVHFGGLVSGASSVLPDPTVNQDHSYAVDKLEEDLGAYAFTDDYSSGVVSAPDPFAEGGFRIYHESISTDPFSTGVFMATGLDSSYSGVDRFIPDPLLGGGAIFCKTPSPAYGRRNWVDSTTTPVTLHITGIDGADMTAIPSRGGASDIFPTRSGDILQIETPNIPAGITTFGVRRYPIASDTSVGGGFFPMPEGVPSTALCRVVAQNDSRTLWMAVVDQADNPYIGMAFQLFRLVEGEWAPVTVPDGFPIIKFAQYGQQEFYNIAHDPITDAIAVVFINPENSGAWIFNGRDCFNQPLGPFFRKFDSTRMDFALTPGDGEPYIYNNAHVAQFYNARLYMRYTSFVGQYDFNGLLYFSVTGASYKVGRLLQKKQSSVE